MTLQEIRNYTELIANKHTTGRTLTEYEFNLAIDAVNTELFNSEYDKIVAMAERDDIAVNYLLNRSKILTPFKIRDSFISVTAGVGSLPSDYFSWLGLYVYDGTSKNCEVVDEVEFNMALNNVYQMDVDEFPIVNIISGTIYVTPANSSTLGLTYLKIPTQPVYDYCIKTSTNSIIYMPVGSYLANTGILYDSAGVIIESGVVNKNGTIPATQENSETVELEWDVDDHIMFANKVLVKMGINLRDMDLYQAVKIEEKEDEAK